jgi:hypothetical protein
MAAKASAEGITAMADAIGLKIAEHEVGPVLERLNVLLDGLNQIDHLVDDTAELDARFNPAWEVPQV